MTYTQLSPEAAACWLGIESDLAPMRRIASSSFTTDEAKERAVEALDRARERMGALADAMRG